MDNNALKLDNQFCFPIYTVSRLITKMYQPLLAELGLTYTQYLVMMVLWERDNISVKQISKELLLESNTLTPLLKRMEKNDFVQRERSIQDERSVILKLTQKGKDLEKLACEIPIKLRAKLENENINQEDVDKVKDVLCSWIKIIDK